MKNLTKKLRQKRLAEAYAHPRAVGALVALAILCISLLIWWQASLWYQKQSIGDQRIETQARITPYANALSTSVNRRLALLEGLQAFVFSDFSEVGFAAQFETFASGLYASVVGIRNFVVAPDGINQYVYPREGNENVPGHNLLTDTRPNVSRDVKRALQTREITLSGPYVLRQGGLGLVARQAIYIENDFWGLVTMVVDLPPLLDEAGLNRISPDLSVAIQDNLNQVFMGDPDVMLNDPVTVNIELPEGNWLVAAVPEDGWASSVQTKILMFHAIALIITVLMTVLAYLISSRQAWLELAVARRTNDLAKELTERKQIESEREILIANLEATNAELERFTYTVSHDLKSPLITIRGFLDLLGQDLAEGDVSSVHEDIDHIHQATEKMGILLDEILKLSRVGRVINPPQNVSLGDLAKEAVKLVGGQIAARGVQVMIAPDLPDVWGDPPRLLEVLQNLIDNAVKYMGDQPVPRIEIGHRRKNGESIFYVLDNGIGIEPRHQDAVFTLFKRLNAEGEGTGIGLALAKRIIELHGGQIWVESKGVGSGSAFCFTLPQAD